MSAVLSHSVDDEFCASAHERSVDELDAAVGRLARQMNSDSYRLLVLVREFDDRFGFKKWGFKTCAEWLAWRADLKLSTAREKVRTAQALRRLPAIASAFEAGRLSYSKAKALTRVAHLHDEALLLKHALAATVPQVEERCRQIRNVFPDSVEESRRAWESRSLTAWRDERRGVLRLTVEVPIEDGELILRALDRAVANGEVVTDVDPDSIAESKSATWRAQQADALVVVMRSYLDGGQSDEGGSTADHYQVVVHADAKAVAGGTGCADLPIDDVKRLLCDCSVVLVAEDEDGNPLDVGRKQRILSTPLKRALYARDRGCTFPGCHRKRWVAGHHLRHWIDGGETNPANLTLLCSHHHGLLHRGAFGIEKEADGALRFVTADGRTIPRNGYRLEDFVDDDIGDELDDGLTDAPRGGFCTTPVQPPSVDEVREPAAVYRLSAA